MNQSTSSTPARVGRSFLVAVSLSALALAGCSKGSTTQAEVCGSYDTVADELDSDQMAGLFDGHIYDAIEELGGTAARYDADSNVAEAGEAMKDLAKQEEISMLQLMGAAAPFESFCA